MTIVDRKYLAYYNPEMRFSKQPPSIGDRHVLEFGV
jgi:hypothetical protein